MSKNKIIVLIITVLVVAGLGFWAYKVDKNRGYSIVYLTTGEVYIGKLTTFPNLQLKDSYIFQAIKDETDPSKNNFQLNPINEALWAPTTLYLVKKNVIFYGPLRSNSKIAETLAAQNK